MGRGWGDGKLAGVSGMNEISYISSGDNLRVLTAGADLRINVWDPSHIGGDAEKTLTTEEDDSILVMAVSPNGDCFATGSEDNIVRLYSYPEMKFKSILTRFTLPVRALAFNATGSTLAAAGDSDGIKLINMEDSKIFMTLESEAKYVKSLAYDPNGDFLASTTADGTLQVWNLDSGEVVFQKDKAAPKVLFDAFHGRNGLQWSPEGDLLGIAGRGGEVTLFKRDTWDVAMTLGGEHTLDVSVVSFSPNARYIASAACDEDSGEIILWDVERKLRIERQKSADGAVCSFAWSPEGNSIAAFTSDGMIFIWNEAVPGNLPSPVGDNEDDFEDALNAMADKLEKEKTAREDEAAAGSDGDEDEGEEDDDGAEDHVGGSPYHSGARAHIPARAAAPPAIPMQPAFQPGSGGADPLGRRFLAYTRDGSIVSKEIKSDGQTGAYRSIEVSFHDTSRPGPRIPAVSDYFGFTMGALGSLGVVYGGPARGENQSTIMYRPFESWAANSDWQAEMPEGENVQAVAVGNDWVACATSGNLLRIFSASGVQTYITALPGPVVTMAGSARQLAVVFHAGEPTAAGGQKLEYMLLSVPHQTRLHGGVLPMRPGATLTWLGFTDGGLLAASDSKGVVSVRCHEFGGSWVPVFSTAQARTSEGEVHWVVGLTEHEVHCVIVCAPATHPRPEPRPVLSILPLCMPIVSPPAKGTVSLEEAQLRGGLHLQQLRHAKLPSDHPAFVELAAELSDQSLPQREVDLDKATLKLFVAACKMDRMEQALELGSMLIRMKSVEGAIKVANAKRLFALSEKLGRTLQYRMDEEALQQEAVAGYMPLSASYHENSQQPSAPAQYADPFQERAPAAAGDEPLVGPKATSGLRALKEKLASKENAGGKRKAADGEGRVPGNNPFAKKAAKA